MYKFTIENLKTGERQERIYPVEFFKISKKDIGDNVLGIKAEVDGEEYEHNSIFVSSPELDSYEDEPSDEKTGDDYEERLRPDEDANFLENERDKNYQEQNMPS